MTQTSSRLKEVLEELQLVHEAFIELSAKERHAVISFETDKVEKITAERQKLVIRMGELTQEERQIAVELGLRDDEKLSALIDRTVELHFLVPTLDKLKITIQRARAENSRNGAVSQFALNVVNGSMAIMRSSGDNTVTSYTRGAKIRESYHPTHARLGAIKEA